MYSITTVDNDKYQVVWDAQCWLVLDRLSGTYALVDGDAVIPRAEAQKMVESNPQRYLAFHISHCVRGFKMDKTPPYASASEVQNG
jgi:hypothetical protein